jgi:hypothetical protein
MALTYGVNRDEGTVTVYPQSVAALAPRHACDRYAHGVDLDESDLITLLSDLQAGQSSLSELAGS